MNGKLWFMITLIDCGGQIRAQWEYNEWFPVTAPGFTYPNQDEKCPYLLRIYHQSSQEYILPCGEINTAIRLTVQNIADKLR